MKLFIKKSSKSFIRAPLLRKKKSGAGFTLVEMLLVGAIIAILTASTLAGLRIQRTKQRLVQDEQKVVALLEKARAYAANPRTQDYRPAYYLVRFDISNKSGSADLGNGAQSNNISLYAFEDKDNDGGSTSELFIESIVLKNTQIILNDYDFRGLENIKDPSKNLFKICANGYISLGFKVGQPHRLLGRCYPSTTGPPTLRPHLIFSEAILEIEFSDLKYRTDFKNMLNYQPTFIKIGGYGETIETCQGDDFDNPDVCN